MTILILRNAHSQVPWGYIQPLQWGHMTLLVCQALALLRDGHTLCSPLATCGSHQSWPWGHESKRSGPTPHWLQHSGKQALDHTWTAQYSWPFWQGCRWAGPNGVRAGEMTPSPLFCHVVAWMRERSLYPSCPLTPTSNRRASLGNMRPRELALPLIGCSTWEYEHCTSSRQHTRAGASGMDAGELALWTWEQAYRSLSQLSTVN